MGYIIVIILFVAVVGYLLLVASRRVTREEPEISPESEGTSYEKPQDEGRV